MNRRSLWLVALAVLVSSVSVAFGAAPQAPGPDRFMPYPLVNGHFYYSRWDRTDHWDRRTTVGEVRFTIDPDPENVYWATLEATWQDVFPAIGMASDTRASACYHQDTPLMPGRYRFSVDAYAGKGARAKVLIDGEGKTVAGTDDWQRVSVEFRVEGARPVAIGLWLDASLTGGSVRFKKAMIQILQLDTAPVPLADGGVLGGIVIPANPDPAEEYAAYELQKYIHKLTGHVPGLKGRDQVFAGKVLAVGGPAPKQIKPLPNDSYSLDVADGKILLRGKQPLGTLYAAYDFLKLQGCRWYWPGRWGEVVPRKETLVVPAEGTIESPDYDVRSLHVGAHRHDPDNKLGWPDVEKYMDWAVRNRMNAFWPQWRTMDFGRHRGTGHLQTTNHSWQRWRSDEHPEWWPLVSGKRLKLHDTGRGNQLCVSNQSLRDQVVQDVLHHFKTHPKDTVFGLSPDDAHVYWCECAGCRALDEDEGKGEWHFRREQKGFETWAGWPALSMTDRVIDFANEVADRVSKVYPDRFIEAYAYAEFTQPPKRHRVHPNVLVKYAFQTLFGNDKGSINTPVAEQTGQRNVYIGDLVACLDGWKKAGAKQLGLYDYYYYPHTESTMFSFFHVADYTRTFHQRWGFRHYMGQSESSFGPSMMMFNLHARVLWDTDTQYKDVIRDVCRGFYGPAADTMIAYYLSMDEVVMNAERPSPMGMEEGQFDLAIVGRAEALLAKARAQAAGDPAIEARVDMARLGQANVTYSLAKGVKKGTPLSPAQREAGQAAFELSAELRRKYDITICGLDAPHLANFYLPPAVEQVIFRLPLTWRFKKDPQDVGQKQKWQSAAIDQGWQDISVEKEWRAQGHDYYGVAWYAIRFSVPDDAKQKLRDAGGQLALMFGAVDGLADIYLDGRKIGQQKKPLEVMWDKPFKIALPADFDPEAAHTLAVRVRKDNHLAGIWRPVSVVKAK